MSAILGEVGDFLDRYIIAVAIAAASGKALEPEVQDLANAAWSRVQTLPLKPEQAAEIAAEDVARYGDMVTEAANSGLDSDRFGDLYTATLSAPGGAELLQMLRRGTITPEQFLHGLRKARREMGFDTATADLANVKLAPNQIALGIVRSLIADPGFLPVSLDTEGGEVPAYGVSSIDPLTEAEAAGIDKERLRVMVGEIGLPMALQAAASAVFREIINEADFNRAVLEGDTRPEWAAAILEQARQIPSVADYVNARIRGWITDDEMYAGAAKHGMSQEDTHLLYLRTGRPAAPGQMATAAARGIDGPDGTPMDEAQFLKGIAESDIRPEWGPMLWESRYLYPPLFQLTRLVQAGAIDAETAADWATKDRYPPDVVAALKAYWNQPATQTSKDATVTNLLALMDAQRATVEQTLSGLVALGYSEASAQTVVDAHNAGLVVSERTRVITAAHKAFIGGSLTGAEANTLLSDLGIAEWARTQMLIVWGLQAQFGI